MRRMLLLSLCLVVPACSPSPTLIPVSGRVTEHGKPLPKHGQRMMNIVFVPAEKGETYSTFPALYNHDQATFDVQGPTGKGIPAGKYKVTIQQGLPVMTPQVEQYNARYSESHTPFIVEVNEQNKSVDLELAKTK